MGHKWLGLKLARLGRDDLVQEYLALLDPPGTAVELAAYREGAERVIRKVATDRQIPEDPLLTLSWADGTTTWQVQDRVLVHRWALRGMELAAGDLAADAALAWTGRMSQLPDDLLALIEEDLVWVSVHEEAA